MALYVNTNVSSFYAQRQLIRKPEDRRWNDVSSWLPDFINWRCAFNELTFVFTYKAIIASALSF